MGGSEAVAFSSGALYGHHDMYEGPPGKGPARAPPPVPPDSDDGESAHLSRQTTREQAPFWMSGASISPPISPPRLGPRALAGRTPHDFTSDVGAFVASHVSSRVDHECLREGTGDEATADDMVDRLADEWARIKLENTELRTSCTSAAELNQQVSSANIEMTRVMSQLNGVPEAPTELPPPRPTLRCLLWPSSTGSPPPELTFPFHPHGPPPPAVFPSPVLMAAAKAPQAAVFAAPTVPDHSATAPVAAAAAGFTSPPAVPTAAAGGTAAAAAIVVSPGDEADEADEPLNELEAGARADMEAIGIGGSLCGPYRSLSYAAGGAPTLASASAPGSKRSRSLHSELLAQPLQPTKQHSAPSSRSSPTAEHQRVQQLRELIQAEKAEREALLAAFRENEETLQRLQERNRLLLAEVERLKQARQITMHRPAMECA